MAWLYAVLCTRAASTICRVVWVSLHTFRRTVSVAWFIVPRPSSLDASVAPDSLYWYTVHAQRPGDFRRGAYRSDGAFAAL